MHINLEQVFDEELWNFIKSLNERGLDSDQASRIMAGFAKVALDQPEEFKELYTTYDYAYNNPYFKNYVADSFNAP